MKLPKSPEATAYKKLRIDAGLSAIEAASMLGITAETLSRRENGKMPITMEAGLAMERITEDFLQVIWSYLASQREPEIETLETPKTKQNPKQTKAPTPPESRSNQQYQWDDLQDDDEPKKQGRNEPCKCGSGRKFKHCCGR
jgi:transcriptional regulator with XRE-family HTH domain